MICLGRGQTTIVRVTTHYAIYRDAHLTYNIPKSCRKHGLYLFQMHDVCYWKLTSRSMSWEFANKGCGRFGGHLLTLNSHEQWINLVTHTKFFEKPVLDYWLIGLKNMQVYVM